MMSVIILHAVDFSFSLVGTTFVLSRERMKMNREE
jgi:hypothetical protein